MGSPTSADAEEENACGIVVLRVGQERSQNKGKVK